MYRIVLMLWLSLAVAGCGGAEATRFIPAGAESGAKARVSAGGEPRATTPPKNIATH